MPAVIQRGILNTKATAAPRTRDEAPKRPQRPATIQTGTDLSLSSKKPPDKVYAAYYWATLTYLNALKAAKMTDAEKLTKAPDTCRVLTARYRPAKSLR
jgi:ABC-type branched-subunit amino acid transport system substrate-binding protein